MAFEPNFEKVVASVRKKVGNIQLQVDCKLPTTDEVKKIICANAKANVTNVENSGKDIVYSGFVNFQIIYLDINNQAISMDYTAEFRDKYQANMELSNVVPIVSVKVVDVNTVVNGDIKATAILEADIDAIVNYSTNVLTDINVANYFVKKETLSYSNYVATATNKFEVLNDLEIKDGVSKVLSVCPSAYIEKVVPQDRFVTVSGGVYLDVCYLTDNNIIRTTQNSFNFEQEIAQDDIDELSVIQSQLQILYNDIKVTTNIDTDVAIINIDLPMLYVGQVFRNSSIEVVGDLYSTQHFTNMVVESLQSINNMSNVVFDEKINGGITLQENDAFIDEILGTCCGSVVIANNRIEDGQLVIEGVASITVIYLNKETDSINSVEVEMPFSISTQTNLSDGMNTYVQMSMTNITTRARRGKEIEVTANLEVYSDIYNINENAVIIQVSEEDEIPENECAMSLYVTKDGDTIWEIAKELKVSTDMLMSQNPNLAEPINAGTRIVVYRQRQVEF